MLIRCPCERAKRANEKQRIVLKWLREEIWTTNEVLRGVLGISRQAVWKTVKKLELAGFVRSEKLSLTGKSVLIVIGITSHGLAFAWDEDEKSEKRHSFQPSRIALSTIPHNIDLQRARLSAENNGWSSWTRGECLGFAVKNRPDAIVTDCEGEVAAVELERTVKSMKRYRQIMATHLLQITAGRWGRVEYVFPNPDLVKRLERIFRSIDYVVVGGQRVPIVDKHHNKFQFYSLNEWPKE